MARTGDSYAQAVEGEGQFWDSFVARRLRQGEMPGSIDWRLCLSQFRYNHDWRPLALGPALVNLRLKEIRYLLTTAVPRPGVRVLDLGCGAGWLSLELARRGAHVTAVDISPANLAIGRYMAEHNARSFPYLYQGFAGLPCRLEEFVGVEYGFGDLNTIELPSAEYDAIVVWDSLHHIAELERLVEQVKKALKPGGIFVGVDHSYVTPGTLEYNDFALSSLDDLHSWITEQDPSWLYNGVRALGQNVDWGPLSVNYDATPLEGFGEFMEETITDLLAIAREGSADEAPAGEESPFEDVSAARLMRQLLESFGVVRFETVCPLIEPDKHFPHYRDEEERIFQHYLAALLIEAGERVIERGQAQGQWFLFHLTPDRSQETSTPQLERVKETLSTLQYIDHLEAEVARKNEALADLEARLRERERELEAVRKPKLPWKRGK